MSDLVEGASMTVVHCRHESYDVYVGRGSGPRGRWGNPFVIGRHGTRDEVIERHRQWFWEEIKAGRVTLCELAKLDGKVLACWCAPRRCHAETIASAASWAKQVLVGELKFDRGSDVPPF